MTKLLFLCKLAQQEILTGVAFLTTRVREPDEDDNKKISRILKYISGTRDLVLTLESDGTGRVKWWVDEAFTVHHDTKSHTGGMMSMGRGAVYSASNKQKLNTTTAPRLHVRRLKKRTDYYAYAQNCSFYLPERALLFCFIEHGGGRIRRRHW